MTAQYLASVALNLIGVLASFIDFKLGLGLSYWTDLIVSAAAENAGLRKQRGLTIDSAAASFKK